MRAVAKVDADGFFIEDVLQDAGPSEVVSTEDGFLVPAPAPPGLYRPRWDFEAEEWVEGMTQAEIDELNKPQPVNSLEKRINDLETLLYDMLM